MTVREKMRKGMLYTDMTEGLEEERINCKELIYDYNNTRPREADKRKELLKKILGNCGENIFIEPPLRMAYGKNTHIGENFYSNFNLVIVDDIEVYIGSNVMIAPNKRSKIIETLSRQMPMPADLDAYAVATVL